MRCSMLDPIPFEDEYSEARNADQDISSATFRAFNTLVTVKIGGEGAAASEALRVVRDECRRYERLFSRTLPNSDISRLNRSRGALTEVDRETFELLKAAKRYCAASEGLFDITIDPVAELWRAAVDEPPSEEALSNALLHVDYRTIDLLDIGQLCFAQLNDVDARVDLGGIAKGYIADKLASEMKCLGLSSFLLNLGGNVYSFGRKPSGNRWQVGIRDPRNPSEVLGAMEIENASAVTSGTYERGWSLGGKAYHHVLSPLTGFPSETDLAGVTVVASKSLDAEGYSTTLLAMGLTRGLEFAQLCPEIIRAHFVATDNRIISLDGRQHLIRQTAKAGH